MEGKFRTESARKQIALLEDSRILFRKKSLIIIKKHFDQGQSKIIKELT